MTDQLAGGRGGSVPLKIRRSSHNNAAALRDPSRGHVGIRHRPHSQRNIDALVDEIQVTVVEDKLNLEVRVFGKKHRQVRNDMEPSKANRCRDAKLA